MAAEGPRCRQPARGGRSTIARKLSVVRRFLGFCEDNGLVENSPVLGSRRSSQTPASVLVLSRWPYSEPWLAVIRLSSGIGFLS